MDEIYFIDEPRNAGSNDHRAPSSTATPVVVSTPGGAIVQRPGAARAVVVQPAQPAYGQPYPMLGRPTQAQLAYGYPYAQPGSLFGNLPRQILGNMTVGHLVDIVAEGIAALWPLPDAPNATGDTSTDVQNHLLYQTALATHTKRDERIRTLGVVLRRLIG